MYNVEHFLWQFSVNLKILRWAKIKLRKKMLIPLQDFPFLSKTPVAHWHFGSVLFGKEKHSCSQPPLFSLHGLDTATEDRNRYIKDEGVYFLKYFIFCDVILPFGWTETWKIAISRNISKLFFTTVLLELSLSFLALNTCNIYITYNHVYV